MSVLLYGAETLPETWTAQNKPHASLSVVLMSCLRRICGLSIMDCVPNLDILSICDTVV